MNKRKLVESGEWALYKASVVSETCDFDIHQWWDTTVYFAVDFWVVDAGFALDLKFLALDLGRVIRRKVDSWWDSMKERLPTMYPCAIQTLCIPHTSCDVG